MFVGQAIVIWGSFCSDKLMHSAYGIVARSGRVGEELVRGVAIRERGRKLDQGPSQGAPLALCRGV